MGFHYLPGGEWCLQIIKDMAAANKPVPFVTLLREGFGSELTASIVKAASPQTKVLERFYYEPAGVNWDIPDPDLYAVGQTMVAQYAARFAIDKASDWIQIINEPVNGIGTASFWRGAMDAAKTLRLHLAVGCWPETWPSLPGDMDGGNPKHDDLFMTRQSTFDMFRQARDEGHVIMLHTYCVPDPGGAWDVGYSMGRQDLLMDMLPADLRNVPFVIGEYGTGKATKYSSSDFVAAMRQGDTALHKPDGANVLGVALWSAGPWADVDHVSSDIGGMKDAITAYLKAY
jgi:hypothetical protein